MSGFVDFKNIVELPLYFLSLIFLMVSKKMFTDLETEKIIKTKLAEVGEESWSKVFWIPVLIFLVFGLYHAYFIYKEDQEELKEHQ